MNRKEKQKEIDAISSYFFWKLAKSEQHTIRKHISGERQKNAKREQQQQKIEGKMCHRVIWKRNIEASNKQHHKTNMLYIKIWAR